MVCKYFLPFQSLHLHFVDFFLLLHRNFLVWYMKFLIILPLNLCCKVQWDNEECTWTEKIHAIYVSIVPCLSIHIKHLWCLMKKKFWWTHYVWEFTESQSEYKGSVLHMLLRWWWWWWHIGELKCRLTQSTFFFNPSLLFSKIVDGTMRVYQEVKWKQLSSFYGVFSLLW